MEFEGFDIEGMEPFDFTGLEAFEIAEISVGVW